MMRRFFLLLVLLSSLHTLRATHIVGGEITYRCLGNDNFEITLQVFRDCYTGVPWFDDPAWVAVYRANWTLASTLLIPYEGIDDTLPITLSNPCLVAPPDVCVNTFTYKDTISLPFSPGGYTLVYQRCCRNQLIRNIIDPLDTGASFLTEISEFALQGCNNSAVFKQWPPVAICINNPINFDHGALDPDGDSLVYKLCTPLNGGSESIPQPKPAPPGPYDPVVWIPPYDVNDMLGGDPMKINPNTGFITGVPNMIGNYVVGICVEEYRNGMLISTTRRDFQYNVADCGQPLAAFFAPEVLCDTKSIKFQNQSSQSTFFRWYFDYLNNPAATSVGFSPIYTYPDTGFYQIMLVANPNEPCTDTTIQTIHVTERYLDADYSLSYPDCNGGLTIAVTDLSIDSLTGVSGWQWTLKGPSGYLKQSNEQNPSFLVNNSGDYILTLLATAGNGCVDTLVQTFSAPFVSVVFPNDELQICPGDSVALNPNFDPAYTYSWIPSAFLDDPNAANPIATPAEPTVYQFVISNPQSPCTATGQVSVDILNPGTLIVSATPPKINFGESTQLEAVFPGANTFVWDSEPTLSATSVFNPTATPLDSTTYYVTAILSSGCESRASIFVPVLFPTCDEPYVFFPNAFSPNGDNENDLLKFEGYFVQSVYWVIYDRWGEKIFEGNSIEDTWDGTYKGKEMPVETYGFYYRVTCPNGKMSEKKGNITLLR